MFDECFDVPNNFLVIWFGRLLLFFFVFFSLLWFNFRSEFTLLHIYGIILSLSTCFLKYHVIIFFQSLLLPVLFAFSFLFFLLPNLVLMNLPSLISFVLLELQHFIQVLTNYIFHFFFRIFLLLGFNEIVICVTKHNFSLRRFSLLFLLFGLSKCFNNVIFLQFSKFILQRFPFLFCWQLTTYMLVTKSIQEKH